jgi:hypothetical protein
MTEHQKKLFAVKTKKSKIFPGLEYPASVDPTSLDRYLAPAHVKTKIKALNGFAEKAGTNTYEEVGVNQNNFAAICVWINFRYENNGLADDHWCNTPRLKTATRAINTNFGTSMTPFHYFELQMAMRKYAKKTLSTYSFELGKKRVEV